jgi:mannose-6-phosphate isomerase-like protein (cupin superfamily)
LLCEKCELRKNGGEYEDKAIVFEAGEGKALSARKRHVFKATRASTNGAFSFMERTLPPGGRKPPPHIHTNCGEAFYVLDGEIEFSSTTIR